MIGKPLAITLLAVTLLPLVNFFYAISLAKGVVFSNDAYETYQSLVILQMIMVAILTIGYIILIVRMKNTPRDKKVLWSLLIILFNIFSAPFYWYLYIWKQSENDPITYQTE